LKVPLPGKGCFTASYPKREWQQVPCGAPSKYPNGPARRPWADTVGNGNDVTALVSPLLISTVAGSFHFVSPFLNATETGEWPPPWENPQNLQKANAFTLQINSQNYFVGGNIVGFPTSACNGEAGCTGWQQFIFSQNQCNQPCIFMEYWLFGYSTPTINACPPLPWQPDGNGNCWFNSASAVAPAISAAELQGTTLTATASGGNDSLTLVTVGGTASATSLDSVLYLERAWNAAEFNVFGDCCLTTANFSRGTTIVPRMTLTDGTQKKPMCQAAGFTGETNNLSFGPTAPAVSGAAPAILFSEASVGALAACAAATSVGDTHLTTFGGTLYDFQASGDFVLLQTSDRHFIVQARQLSGAPVWPNATTNQAVATRMGTTDVAVCPPLGNLVVNGKPIQIQNGKVLEFPSGVDVERNGNVYIIRNDEGNWVRAQVVNPYINISVGLGRWPAIVRGILANANGNVNEIEARDGSVLTAPFGFADLYHHYAESWSVPARESLLSPCKGKVELRLPKRPFFARDLSPKQYITARAICKGAGVEGNALLDACTLDVTVTGNKAAAKVFIGVQPPAKVGNRE
jgi:hypothetical protein